MRLKDLEGMEQEEAAEHMEVSRPTFQRILAVARRKIACALLTGKAIRIEGGNFRLAKCCLDKIDGIAVDYSRSNEPVKIKEVRMENRNERKALSIEH